MSALTAIKVGMQVTQRLADIHQNRITHLDVKPRNLTVGLGNDSNVINLIDFGVSEFFLNESRRHIVERRVDQSIGTYRFMSINSHGQMQLSRRDDIESMAYLLIHICRPGGLPWGLRASPNKI